MPVAQSTPSFPSACLPTAGQPIEVTLITQLHPGAGTPLCVGMQARQTGHATFVDHLDEPAARLGSPQVAHGDPSALHSFAVGPHGHPFHRHASPRMFTAIAGSGGAHLYFADVPDEVLATPEAFLAQVRAVEVPPDSLFTVRFGAGVWHQFVSAAPAAGHPAFFALSCHPNELGGELPPALRAQVIAQQGDIAALTDVLPDAVAQAWAAHVATASLPRVVLSLDAPPGSLQHALCQRVRSLLGRVCRARAFLRRRVGGFLHAWRSWRVIEAPRLPTDSLLHDHLSPTDHQDRFSVTVEAPDWVNAGASASLAAVLDGFMNASPRGVARLMALRNTLVRPLGLRTSPLGCPVSSLLSSDRGQLFAHRFPVLDQRVSPEDRHAQVILGANDKHLRFRSCVSVRCLDAHRIEVSLATRVQEENLWGHLYWTLIDRVHRRYVSPALLRTMLDRVFVEPVLVATPA